MNDNKAAAFIVTKNALDRDADMKSIHAIDPRYSVKIVYYGDYRADFKSGKIDRNLMIPTIKPRGPYPDLMLIAGHITVRNEIGILPPASVPEYTRKMTLAMESAESLERLIDEYFPNR